MMVDFIKVKVHDLFSILDLRFGMPITMQTYLTNQIESVVRSTVAARSLQPYQVRILAWRIARLVHDELAITRENAME